MQVNRRSGQGGRQHESGIVLTADQLKAELDPWVTGGTVEGQRMGRIIAGIAEYHDPGTQYPDSSLKGILGMRVYFGRDDVSPVHYQGFLAAVDEEGWKKIGGIISENTPRQVGELGLLGSLSGGTRARYARSLEALKSIATTPLPQLRKPGGVGLTVQEDATQELYQWMHKSNQDRLGGRQDLTPARMMYYRMNRLSRVMYGKDFGDDERDPLAMLEFMDFAEPRISSGLTRHDWRRANDVIGIFKKPGRILSPQRIESLSKGDRMEYFRGRGYEKALTALDGFLRDPTAWMRGIMKADMTSAPQK
ncbi:hypothetical protein ACFLRF_03560, partial [Candidatus Altiarchaeota archaeon]